MLGVNHTVINITLVQTFASVTGIFVHPACYFAAAIGSIFPDRAEKICGMRWAEHRTVTHTLSYWLLIIPIVWLIISRFFDTPLLLPVMHSKYALIPSQMWLWFSFGIIMHLIEDMMTMSGIPITPQKKAAFRWFKAGAWQEKAMALAAGGLYVWLIHNNLSLPLP